MLVHIPWKGAWFPLRPHQVSSIEHDSKGMFLRVLNASTGRLNKCRVAPPKSPKKSPNTKKSPTSPKKLPTLYDLVGRSIHGTVRITGDDYVALVVDVVDGLHDIRRALVKMAKSYMKLQTEQWNVQTPRSWDLPISDGQTLGPHVSLHNRHKKDSGKRISLVIAGVMHWEEHSRWVALKLRGPVVDKHDWIPHMSCAQEP